MISLTAQKDFQPLRKLTFCYLCGKDFVAGDDIDRDHVPAQSAIAKRDREPLLLPTHVRCNRAYHLSDQKVGQLIALRRGEVPRKEVRRLRFAISPHGTQGAVTNIDLDAAIWRWIAGFHAALYRVSPVGIRGSLVTPFPRARKIKGRFFIDPLKPQHHLFVHTIKQNRARKNLDRISCNKGAVVYECVWCQSDNSGPWLCIFALNIYDWKDLGRTTFLPARGCAGHYVMPAKDAPPKAAKHTASPIVISVGDTLDAFTH